MKLNSTSATSEIGVLHNPFRVGRIFGYRFQGSPKNRATLGCAAKRFQRNAHAATRTLFAAFGLLHVTVQTALPAKVALTRGPAALSTTLAVVARYRRIASESPTRSTPG